MNPSDSKPDDTPGQNGPATPGVPEDFPRDLYPAALSGTQPKFAARLIDGCCVVGLTPEERLAQYLMCQDLAEQLLAYHSKHQQDTLPMGVEMLIERFHYTLRAQSWPVSPPEARWIEQHLRQRLGAG